MTLLILGLALWWASHLFPIWAPNARAAAVARLGKGPYRGLYSAVSLGAVVLMVIGYRQADFINLWYPPAWTMHLNNLLMVLALALMEAKRFKSGLRRMVRHPMLTAVKTWAVAHLLVNGDLASVVLFGGMLAWAVLAVIGSSRRDGEWQKPEPGTWKGAAIHAAVTVVILLVVIYVHGPLLGVRPIPG